MLNKHIADVVNRHITARKNKSFDNIPVKNRRELVVALYGGKTFEKVLSQIEVAYCNPISVLIMSYFGYATFGYQTKLYEGFEKLLVNK